MAYVVRDVNNDIVADPIIRQTPLSEDFPDHRIVWRIHGWLELIDNLGELTLILNHFQPTLSPLQAF